MRGEQAGTDAEEGQADRKAEVVELDVERGQHDDRAEATEISPSWRPASATGSRASRGPVTAAISIAADIGMSFDAGLEGVEADHDLEIDRQDEEGPEQDQLLDEQGRQPGPKVDDVEQREVEQPVAPGPLSRPSHEPNATRMPRPPRIRNGTTEKPSGSIVRPATTGLSSRQDQAPRAALEDGEDDDRETRRRQDGPDDVEARRPVEPRARLHPPRNSRMTATITTSPTKT